MKIMLVEDDGRLAEEIAVFLDKWGYEVCQVQDFRQVGQEFGKQQASLVLMDVNLPYYDGFYWCSQIRQISQVPILFISSRNDDRDQIMAIAQGADDYVEKPFQLELLKAKIEAVLRRTYQYQVREQVLVREHLLFDSETQSLYYQKTEGKQVAYSQKADTQKNGAGENRVLIELTRSEQKIFLRLLQNKGQVVSREELMNLLWDTDDYVSDGTLSTLISRLRHKLQDICGEEIIGTRKGQGYLLL